VSANVFVGREAELDEVARRLAAGTSVLLMGPRRIGKTELLKHVCDRSPGLVSARVDLEGLRDVPSAVQRLAEALRDTGKLRHRVIEAVAKLNALELKGVVRVEKAAASPPWIAFEELLDAAVACLDKRSTLALLLDEVPWWLDELRRLSPEGEARRALAQLRYLRQREPRAARLRMVLTGSVGLAGMAEALDASAELNDLDVIELGPLRPEDGAALFEAELAARSIDVARGVADKAYRLAGGSPHWIRQLASRTPQRAASFTAGDAELAAALESLLGPRMRSLFQDEARGHFLRRYGVQQATRLRAVLHAAAWADGPLSTAAALGAALEAGAEGREAAQRLVHLLVDEFYLQQKGDHVHLVNPLFGLWWRKYGGTA
jgi:hypothetical protein